MIIKNILFVLLCLSVACSDAQAQQPTFCLLAHCTDTTPLQRAILGDSLMAKWYELDNQEDYTPAMLNDLLKSVTLLYKQAGLKFKRGSFNGIRYASRIHIIPGMEDLTIYELSYKQEKEAIMLESLVGEKAISHIAYSVAEGALFYLYRKKQYVYIFAFESENMDNIDPPMQAYLKHCREQLSTRISD